MYEYFRNDKLDANEFFANRQGRGKVPFRQNQYGMSFGGPVVLPKIYNGRDKTFWFTSWEGFRLAARTDGAEQRANRRHADRRFLRMSTKIYDPVTGTTDAQGHIIRQPFPNNIIPANRINPGMKYVAGQADAAAPTARVP